MSAASWLIFVPVTSTSTFTPTPAVPAPRPATVLMISRFPEALTFTFPPAALTFPSSVADTLLFRMLTTALMAGDAPPLPAMAALAERSL